MAIIVVIVAGIFVLSGIVVAIFGGFGGNRPRE